MLEIQTDLLQKVFNKEPVILFIGQSGCGKETQSKILQSVIKKVCPEKDVFISETGGLYRKEIPLFSEYNRDLIAKIQDAGKLQDWTTTSALWIHNFLYNYNGGVVITDGSPRSIGEAKAVRDFYCDYAGKEIIGFLINISDEEAEKRMIKRNQLLVESGKPPRSDTDTFEKRKEKLSYFHRDVIPALEYLYHAPGATINTINGSGDPSSVSGLILSMLQNYHYK